MLTSFFWLGHKTGTVRSAPLTPQIIITQVKITSSNGQFITLYNNTNNPIDLSTIQLQYYNNFDLLKATSGKLISLSGKVPAHGYAVVDDGPIQACFQMTVNSVSLGLSSTAGFIQVAHFAGTSSPQFVSILDDYVGWSRTAATGAQTLPSSTSAFLQRKTPDNSQNFSLITAPGTGAWAQVGQPDGSAACDTSSTASAGAAGGGSKLTAGSVPIPYTVIAAVETLSSIPLDDNGLSAPQISEVLPNPASPQTDADDEFIELYNPNDKPFNLGGFTLQVGTTSVHKYKFPDGTSIEPHKFSVFFSSDTSLSLSNSEGQVKLLDPEGNVLNQTDVYATAKDGYAWVSADGLWQWTTSPTPGAANVITLPPLSKSKAKTLASPASKSAVKGAKTTSSKSAPASSGSFVQQPPAQSLHPLVLAGIGGAALLYALYEYRHDLGNFIYKLRRDRGARQVIGQ
jgi:hypothetical protein